MLREKESPCGRTGGCICRLSERVATEGAESHRRDAGCSYPAWPAVGLVKTMTGLRAWKKQLTAAAQG